MGMVPALPRWPIFSPFLDPGPPPPLTRTTPFRPRREETPEAPASFVLRVSLFNVSYIYFAAPYYVSLCRLLRLWPREGKTRWEKNQLLSLPPSL